MFKFSVVSETTPGTSTMAVLCSGLEMATLENAQLWALKRIQQGDSTQLNDKDGISPAGLYL